MAPISRSMHNKFRHALLTSDLRQVRQVVEAYARAKQLSTQNAIAELMCHIYEDDCCGNGLLYLAAGCKMSSRALQCMQTVASGNSSSRSSSRGSRPSVFNYLSGSCYDSNKSSSSSSSSSSMSFVDSNKPKQETSQQLSVFSRWYYGSSSSKQHSDPAAARAEILDWLLTVMSDVTDRSWLNLELVNSRCQSALHLCLLNGSSTAVLRLLLQHASNSSSSNDSSAWSVWSLEDAAGVTALHLAIALQDWKAVRRMVAAGAAAAASSSSSTSSSEMAAAQQTIDGLLSGRRKSGLGAANAAAAGSSRSGGGGSATAAAAGSSITAVVGQLVSHMFSPSSSNATRSVDKKMQHSSSTNFSHNTSDQAAVQASDVSAVAAELKQAVQQVAEVASVPPATAMTLLAANAYDVDRAIDAAYNNSSNSSIVEVDTTEVTAASSSSGSSRSCCVVCFEQAALADHLDDGNHAAAGASSSPSSSSSSSGGSATDKITVSVQLPCGHVTCDSCWRGVITACIDELGVLRAVCPVVGCGAVLPLDAVEQLVDEQVYQRYLSLLAHHVIDSSPQRRWCPAPNCGRSLRFTHHQQQQQQQRGGSSSSSRGFDVGCACGCRFCWLCQEPAHEPATCQQVVAWRQLLTAAAATAEDQSSHWVAANTRCCPKCSSRIQRDGGCNHMTCRICGTEFCWVCGGSWTLHSKETGGYYDCNLKQTAAAAGAVGQHTAQQQQQQQGSLLRQVFGSVITAVQNAVLDHKQKMFLGLHLQHEINADKITVLLRYQQLLLAAANGQQQQQRQVSGDANRPTGIRSLFEGTADKHQQQQSLLHLQQHQQYQQLLHQLSDLPKVPPASPARLAQQQQQQQFYAPLTDALVTDWLSCVVQCKKTLRWSCVLSYYIKSAAARSYLEYLQDRLLQPADQLLALIQQLPAAQQVVDAAAAATVAKHKTAAVGAAVRTMRSFWGNFWQKMGYSSGSSGGDGGSTPDSAFDSGAIGGTMHANHPAAAAACGNLWFDVSVNALLEQVHYVLAVSSRLADVQSLIHQAHCARGVLLRAARQGAFDGGDAKSLGFFSAAAAAARNAAEVAAAGGGSSAAGSREVSEVTMLDIVAAGRDVAFLGDVLAAGAAEVWRSVTRLNRA